MRKNVKIFAENLDQNAYDQVHALAESPLGKGETLRIMPDAHAGAGCVIGTTLTYSDKICPNIVGVDIGCGMLVAELGRKTMDLADFDDYLKKRLPSGFNIHNRPTDDTGLVEQLRCYKSLQNLPRIHRSLGTLGGGNHFIELNQDDDGNLYLVIHTGSRNLGKQVADIYQHIAKRTNDHGNLSYLTGQDLADYLHDMDLIQQWAGYNRHFIYDILADFIYATGEHHGNTWETIHNYVSHADDTIRKGAIRAPKDEKVLIPLNMRDGSLICIGKGNPDWNFSAPHGAGRLMSRTEARRKLNLQSFEQEMKGVYTTTAGKRTLDEAPMAYKDSDMIKRLITPTVTIKKHIRPIYNFKSTD